MPPRQRFASLDPMEQEPNARPMELVPPLTDSELAEVGALNVLNALKDLGRSEREIVEVLIAWGMAFDDVEGMDDVDEQVLSALIAVRDDQPPVL